MPEPQPAPAAGPIFTVAGDVAFDFDSARIRPEFHPTLDEIAAALRRTPGQRLALTGHTDAIGPEPYNQELSLRRARAMRHTCSGPACRPPGWPSRAPARASRLRPTRRRPAGRRTAGSRSRPSDRTEQTA